MTIAGLLGFSMAYVTANQIKITSSSAHNVSVTLKAYVQTLLAVIIYNEVRVLKKNDLETKVFILLYYRQKQFFGGQQMYLFSEDRVCLHIFEQWK